MTWQRFIQFNRIRQRLFYRLTAYEDLQLAEVEIVCHVKLQNDVSVCRQVAAGTRQVDGGAQCNITRVLTTQVVVPQGRCCQERWDVRHTDNEVVTSAVFRFYKIRSTSRIRYSHRRCENRILRQSRQNTSNVTYHFMQISEYDNGRNHEQL